MGKFRTRVSAKGKRWRKGQSSSSNPSTTKYRDQARSGFFQPNQGESGLTQEALTQHDVLTKQSTHTLRPIDPEQDAIDPEDSVSSVGGKTFKTFDTFASDWTHCSNASFSKLIKNFRSDSAVQKEVLAVLAAVAEVIREQGGSGTSTEYFASLMTALDSDENDDGSVYAVLTLLSMGIKTVPQSVLQLKFAQSTRTLMNLLAKYAQSENVAVLRPIIGCLSVLLRSQETQSWNDPYTIKVLDSLLAFITFSKPKIRKSAQHGVKVVVLSSNISESGISHVAEYCVNLIENITCTSVTSILHVLALLKDIMHLFSKKQMKRGCEACLKVMTMQNVLVTSCCLQALHGMLSGKPPSKALPPDRNSRLITALYDYQPPPSDSQPTQAWLATLVQAHLNLYRNDRVVCLSMVNGLYTTVTSLYLTEKPDIMTAVTHSLTLLMETIFSEPTKHDNLKRGDESTRMKEEGLASAGSDTVTSVVAVSSNHISVAKALSLHLKELLTYKYHTAWTHILHLIKTLFKSCCSVVYSEAVGPCLTALATLRDSNQFCYNNEVESALAAAVRSLGPKTILDYIPLKVNKNDESREFKRSWILPVLKNNIQHSDLKLFIDYFLPQAVFCRNESDRLKSLNDQIGSVSFDLLQSQIWSLLPSFSTRPADISSSFPSIAKALGGVLNSKKDLRMSVLTCLRKLVTYSVDNGRHQDIATMSRFSKNYLPILFSIYSTPTKGTDEDATRLATLETIKVYLKVADKDLVSELFTRAVDKLKEEGKEEFVRTAVLDLLRALLGYLDNEQLTLVYTHLTENITTDKVDHRQQKKYFRLIEELCCNESESCKEFLSCNHESVRDIVLNSLSKSAASSKGARLRCLSHLLKRESDPSDLIATILPETVLCVKDINSSTRDTAYSLLVSMADLTPPDQFIAAVMAGLAGSPSTIACSLLSLAATIYHYRDKLAKSVEEEVLYNVGLLTVCSTREVVTAALSFIKVYIQALPRNNIQLFLPNLMSMLSKMNEEVKRACRTKVRDLLARLVRWFGSDVVLMAVPADDMVLRTRVRNLAKINMRRKRDKEASKQKPGTDDAMDTDQFTVHTKPKTIEEILAESDSDMDLEEVKTKKNSNGRQTYITETPGDIVDFTDLSTSKKISASKPAGSKVGAGSGLPKKQSKKTEFKTAPDGRLIISEAPDSDQDQTDNSGAKKKCFIPGLEDSEDDYEASEDEDRSAVSGPSLGGGKKRALSTSTAPAQPNKYRAGGIGIHRPVQTLLSGRVKHKKTARGSNKGPSGTSGLLYKSSKAGGDVKRKGLPDPYAYLPLRRDNLNKRKKMKAGGEFRNVMRGARKGAKMASKHKLSK